jgi:hypothetical protein
MQLWSDVKSVTISWHPNIAHSIIHLKIITFRELLETTYICMISDIPVIMGKEYIMCSFEGGGANIMVKGISLSRTHSL